MAFYCVDEEKNIFFPLFRIARAKKIAFSAIKTARKALYIMFLYMRLRRTRHIAPVLLLALAVLAAACSTQKNTAKSRAWHSFKAKYNAFYNGKLAYIDGTVEKENGNKDNFTEVIPLYTVGNKQSRQLGSGNFDKAIEKSQKVIKLHSIKRKPEWTKKRRKTERDLEWLNRKEYNPFLWKAWLMMGQSQFYKGSFDEAASTFSYMSRIYHTQPAIYGRARAWLAKSYVELDWLYDAEDVIRNMSRDFIHPAAQHEWDYTMADYYIHAADYQKAIPYLRKVIRHENRKKQKARQWFLMGQLQSALGQKTEAYKAYQRVVRLNPPYEVEFNARIAMTEVFADTQGGKMIRRLKRMAISDKNKEYLDQVYYAIGNIYMSERDTLNAIAAYEKGNTKSTRNGIEKGVLLLRLGDIYWAMEKYNDAQRCYGEAIGLLDKERDDYEQLSHRSQVLDQLVPYTDAVHLQDSLLELSTMSEADRNAAIDRVIDELKRKEKEERDKLAEEEAARTQQRNAGQPNRPVNQNPAAANQQQDKGLWYFYNPTAVNQGKTQFQKQWGKRENVDNWQRVNKSVVADDTAAAAANGEETGETAAEGQTGEQTGAADGGNGETPADTLQNDPHNREYYLAQIPFTDEQKAECHLIIQDGLYNSAVIFKDKLDNLHLSEKAFTRLRMDYPEYEGMDNAYYHLFLLHSRKGEHQQAADYVSLLQSRYPESQWTALLTDPNFEENSRFGLHLEDSLYAATYEAFKADRADEVRANADFSATRFPLGANRDKFIFIDGLTKLNQGDADGCLEAMTAVVEQFPSGKVGEMAGMIINGVKQGRQLRGGRFDIGDVWQRRTAVLNDNDTTDNRQFSNERNTDFIFMIAYMPDSVNENQLLYEVARYNFTSYFVRNFDIEIDEDAGLHRMILRGFRNYDEALQYARALHKQAAVVRNIRGGRSIVISQENLALLGTRFSYDDYAAYYDKHFAPLKVSDLPLLIEPTEQDLRPAEEPTVEEVDKLLDDPDNYDNGLDNEGDVEIETDFIMPDEDIEPLTPQGETIPQGQTTPEGQTSPDGEVIPVEPVKQTPVEDDGEVIPVEPVKQTPVEDEGEVIIPVEPVKQTPVEDDGEVIPVEPVKQTPVEDDGEVIIPVEPTKQTPVEDDGEVIIPVEPASKTPIEEDDGEVIIPIENQ